MAPKAFSDDERALVTTMIAAGATRAQMARALACSVSTLRRHFGPVIDGKKPRGVPAREFTSEERQLVAAGAAIGVARAEIAKILGIGVTSLNAEFSDELANGAARANLAVGAALYRNATDFMSIQAQKFWLKTRAGWVEAEADVPEVIDEPDLRAQIGSLDDAGRNAMRTVLEQLGARSALTEHGPEPGEPIN